jgi:hypothetical protein
VALLLGSECRLLLIGEGAHRDVITAARDAAADDAVVRVADVTTLQMGPHTVLVHLDLVVRAGQSAEQLVGALARIERRARGRQRDIDRVAFHLATSD